MEKLANSKRRRWGITLTCILGVILAATLLLPTFLSSNSGKRWIITVIEKNTGGKLTIETLSLGWFQDQQIDHLEFIDNKGRQIGFDKLTSELPLWKILTRSGRVGTTHIQSPNVVFRSKKTKTQNLSPPSPSAKVKQKKNRSFWSNFKGRLLISNGTMKAGNEMTIEALSLDIDMTETSKIESIKLHGITKQNGVSGSFNVNGKLEEWFVGTATIDQLPVEGVDAAFSILYPNYQGMLLEAFGDTVDAQITSTPNGDMLFSLRSPRLVIDLAPKYRENALSLNQQGRIAWTIKPTLLNRFSPDALLQEDVQGQLNLDSLTLPLNKTIDFSSSAFKGKLSLNQGHFFIKKIDQLIGINTLMIDVSTKSLKETLSLNLNGQFSYKESQNSMLRMSGSIQNIFEKERSLPSVDLRVDHFPLALIDGWSKIPVSKYFGETLSGHIEKSEEKLTLSGKTPLLQLSDTVFTFSDRAELTAPSRFSYLVQPILYKNLTHPFLVNGTLLAASIPLKDRSLLVSEADFDLDITTDTIDLDHLPYLGLTSLSSIAASFKGSSLKGIAVNGRGAVHFSEGSLGESIVGNLLTLGISGTLKDQKNVSPLDITLNGNNLQTTINGAIEKNCFILRNELKVDLLVTPDQINPFLSKDNNYPLLSKETSVQVGIQKGKIPLSNGLEASSLKGSGKIDALSMIAPSNRYPFELKEIELDFDFDGRKKSQAIHIEGRALENSLPEGRFNLTLTGKGKGSDFIVRPEKGNISLSNFSSQIGDVFLKTRGNLPNMIGKTFNLKCEMEKTGKTQNINLLIKSPNLELDATFLFGATLDLRKPLTMRWNINQGVWDAFMLWKGATKPSPLKIDGTTALEIQIPALSIPIENQGKGFPKPHFTIDHSFFDANVHIDHLRFKGKTSNGMARLKDFKCSLSKSANRNAPLSFAFDGEISPDATGSKGDIQGTGKLKDFLSSEGALDLSQVTTSIQAEIKNLPTLFIDAIYQLNPSSTFPPSALLGERINANFDAEIKNSQGKVIAQIDASACKAYFSGMLSEGILYLNKPLKATFSITDHLNDILDKGAGLVVTGMEKPMTLSIDEKGFALPLKNLSIRNMSFNHGTLDLGKIICKNGGSAEKVGILFKIGNSHTIPLWFAPSTFNMRQGKMKIDRTEVLFNDAYEICLWGALSFPNQKVSMTLGLTAQALRAAFGIKEISDRYVLKIRVKGPFGNVKIDTPSAAGKIALLAAREYGASKKNLFGQVLGEIGKLADDQSNVPPPKPPFPWQKNND